MAKETDSEITKLNDEDLRQKRGELATEIRRMSDVFESNGKQWKDDEQRQTYETVNGDYDATYGELMRRKAACEIAARALAVEGQDVSDVVTYRPGGDPSQQSGQRDSSPSDAESRDLAFNSWLRHQNGVDLTERHRQACQRMGFNPGQTKVDFRLRGGFNGAPEAWSRQGRADIRRRLESRALTTQTGSSGKYAIPEGFSNELEMALLEFGGPRQVARILRTSEGNDLPWPTVNDTGNKGALLAENASVNTQDIAFGVVTFGAYKYESKAILVPQELIEDEAVNLPAEIGRMLGERLGRITAQHFTTGTGSGQPNGLVTAATVGVTAASATAITADELIDLQHSVDPAYRSRPSAGFMLHDSILAAIRKLKDGNSQYLWQPGLRGDVPDLLLNHPYTVNQDMASAMAINAKTVLFGDYSKYIIREVNTVRFYRLEERYRDADQTGFMAFMRVDGDLVDAGTNPVKVLQQAAV